MRGRPNITLEESLVLVPGVSVRNQFNLAQDLRISIRGFGVRSAFGIHGIQIYADGLPLTLPDGQTNIDSADPSVVQKIEILRGPISALYGKASGGVINIITREGPEKPAVEFGNVAGKYGLWKSIVQGGGQGSRINSYFNLSHL